MMNLQLEWSFIRSLFYTKIPTAAQDLAFTKWVVAHGFTDVPDYLNTIIQVSDKDPATWAAFKVWRKKDNSKTGLLAIISKQPALK